MSITLDAWERRLRAVPRIMKPLSLEAVQSTLRKGVNVAEGVVPVRTHRLQNSISIDSVQVEANRTIGEYSAKASYAKFVEEGTVHFGPRRFMQTSARIITPKFKRAATTIAIKTLAKTTGSVRTP